MTEPRDGGDNSLVFLDPVMRDGFTNMPNAILTAKGLSLGAKVIYCLLHMFAWQSRNCWPGQDRLAEAAGCSKNAVGNYLRELRDYGLIYWQRRGLKKSNVYFIERLENVEALKDPESQKTGFKNHKFCDSRNTEFVTQETQNLVTEKDSCEKDSCEYRESKDSPGKARGHPQGNHVDTPALTSDQHLTQLGLAKGYETELARVYEYHTGNRFTAEDVPHLRKVLKICQPSMVAKGIARKADSAERVKSFAFFVPIAEAGAFGRRGRKTTRSQRDTKTEHPYAKEIALIKGLYLT
ncbi:MAG: helix-turn-helix domain-containing protein [Desulforudis sp.]|nr:MAG: helix-turn-helix domain-containing protein [Desulforudis sp.]